MRRFAVRGEDKDSVDVGVMASLWTASSYKDGRGRKGSTLRCGIEPLWPIDEPPLWKQRQ